jgi:nicotinamidase-related amidase
MQLDLERTALVVTDPQNDFLSPAGVTWGVVGESVTELHGRQPGPPVRRLEAGRLERGFEVAVVRDATAAARIPDGDGYLAGLTNFRFMANAVWTTDEAVARLQARRLAPASGARVY